MARHSALGRYAVSLSAAAVLAGCGVLPFGSAQGRLVQDDTQLPLGTTGVGLQNATVATRSDRGASWMAREARTSDLLYVVADLGGEVDVLTFPQFKLVGKLTGFLESSGVCSDTQGNVWIADDFASTLVEYAHGGTTPIATLDDPNQYPISCSFDPKTGDLAVSNSPVASGGPNIAIYAHETGPPVLYHNSSFSEIMYLGYGPRSQLFFDGTIESKAAMGRFHNGAFVQIKAPLNITFPPGGIQYADGRVTTDAHGGGKTAVIYRMTDSGVIKGTTKLLGAYTCQAYLIWEKVLVCPSGYNDLREYPYPQGGRYIRQVPLSGGIQVTMSTVARHR